LNSNEAKKKNVHQKPIFDLKKKKSEDCKEDIVDPKPLFLFFHLIENNEC